MHASRMRTVRRSGWWGVYPSIHWAGGCVSRISIVSRGVSAWGRVCVCVCAQGVSAQGGGVCPGRGCLPREGLPAQGVCIQEGCLPGGYLPQFMLGDTPLCVSGGMSAPVHAGIHPPWTEFLTHAYENITFPQLRCGR